MTDLILTLTDRGVSAISRGRKGTMPAFFLLAPLAFGGTATAAPEGSASPAPIVHFADDSVSDEARVLMLRTAAKLEAEIERIDTAQFNHEALLEELDYDFSAIFRFVRDSVAYERYSGALRGADGTLRAAAGNSLDQAILLAKLLRDAGYEARIAEGSLPAQYLLDALARGLMRRDSRPVYREGRGTRQEEGSPDGGTAASFGSNNPASPNAEPPMAVQLRSKAEALGAELLSTIRQAGHPIPKPSRFSNDATPYYWVDARETASQGWRALHPALGSDPEPIDDPVPSRHFVESIPVELQHRVGIQAFMEVRLGQRLKKVMVTDQWVRPAASLQDFVVTYVNMPTRFLFGEERGLYELQADLASSELFVPFINGQPAAPENAFTLAGDLLPASEAVTAMKGLFQTVSGKFNSAAGGLAALDTSGSDERSAARELLRFWLEITISSPGEAPRKLVRELADRNQSPKSFVSELSREVRLRVQTGRTSPALHVNRVLQTSSKQLREMARAGSIIEAPQEPAPTPGPSMSTLHAGDWYFILSDALSEGRSGVTAFRSRPAVVATYHQLTPVAGATTGFDILTNGWTALDPDDGSTLPEASFMLDIEGAVIEDLLFGSEDCFDDTAIGRLSMASADRRWSVVSSESQSPCSGTGTATERRMESDLEQSRILVLDSSRDCESVDAWWSVDSRTGETIARLDLGWGGVIKEYLHDLRVASSTIAPARVWGCAAGCVTIAAALKLAILLQTVEEVTGEVDWDVIGEACDALPGKWAAICRAVVAALALLGHLTEMAELEGVIFRICMSRCIGAPFPVPPV